MRQEFLKEKIASVEKTTKDVEKELFGARKTIDLGKEGIHQMKDDMKSYSVPNVFSYIQQTGESYDLEHQISEWQRKESFIYTCMYKDFQEIERVIIFLHSLARSMADCLCGDTLVLV